MRSKYVEALRKLPPKFKINKAYNKDYSLSELVYPKITQRKYDGMRCLIVYGIPFTSDLKPLPNLAVDSALSSIFTNAKNIPLIDCELLANPDGGLYDAVGMFKAKRRADGDIKPFSVCVFDMIIANDQWRLPYELRSQHVEDFLMYSLHFSQKYMFLSNNIFKPDEILIQSEHDAIEYTKHYPKTWEGLVFRSPSAPYKFGRSTLNENTFLKWVPWHYSSGKIRVIHMEVDQFGRGKSAATQKALEKTRAGAFTIKSPDFQDMFRIGLKGDIMKQHAYNNPELYLDTDITFKYKEVGKTKPRSPILVKVNL